MAPTYQVTDTGTDVNKPPRVQIARAVFILACHVPITQEVDNVENSHLR